MFLNVSRRDLFKKYIKIIIIIFWHFFHFFTIFGQNSAFFGRIFCQPIYTIIFQILGRVFCHFLAEYSVEKCQNCIFYVFLTVLEPFWAEYSAKKWQNILQEYIQYIQYIYSNIEYSATFWQNCLFGGFSGCFRAFFGRIFCQSGRILCRKFWNIYTIVYILYI